MPRYRGTPEGSVRSVVQDYLTTRRYWWTRMQTGAHVATSETTGKKRFIRFGTKGMADILCIRAVTIATASGTAICLAHKVYWIETKGTKGQTPEQKLFQKEVEDEGHMYILARSLDDVTTRGL